MLVHRNGVLSQHPDTSSSNSSMPYSPQLLYRGLVVLLLLIVFAPVVATAQDLAGLEQGIKPYGSYEGGNIDSISMVNGSLTLHMPLISYPQRGGKLHVGFSLMYANPILQPWATCNPRTQICTQSGYNVNYGAPKGTSATYPYAINAVPDFFPEVGVVIESGSNCQIEYYTAIEPDGAVHEMAPIGSTSQYLSADTTGYLYQPSSETTCSGGVLTDRQGTHYEISGQFVPTTIQDVNGNFITTNQNPQGGVTSWTDTLGRVIPSTYTTSSLTGCPATATSASTWGPPGPNGSTLQYKFCWATINISFTAPNCTPLNKGCQPTSTTNTQMVGLVLPNSTAWTFAYDSFGELIKITLPTGGSISYAWTYTSGNCVGAPYVDPISGVNTGLLPYRRAVTQRTVNDGTGAHTWNYVLSSTQIGGSLQTIATDPLGNDTVHSQTALGSTCSLYETETDQYVGSHTSGTELQTTATNYSFSSNSLISYEYGNVALNVVPTTITTTDWVPGTSGEKSQVTKTYDSGISGILYGDVLTESHSDFGNGSPGNVLSQTVNQYMALSGPNANYYLANNLLSLPYTVQINDGNSNKMAVTQYGYDETGLQSSNVNEQKVSGESYPGNQTSVHRWLNGTTVSQAPCSVSVSNGYLISNNVFYNTGEVQQSSDPCGYATTYLYSSAYFGAYPTSVTNALAQVTTYGYDFNMGSVTSIEDPNSQTTTKSYDSMDRLINVTYPDDTTGTPSISYCYTDGVASACPSGNAGSAAFAVVETKLITSSISEISTATVDGLGRLSQTQLNSDPSGTTYALTNYDALGRKSQVYNPTRCSSITTNCSNETTWGVSTYNYDALNRVTSVTEQDGSVAKTGYDQTRSPNTMVCSTTTDEAGKARQSCMDGLGRMTGVWEDPSGLNYETDYAYDALNNLLSVTQKGTNPATPRPRSFQYDSLSHLASASNPESGSISYAYDADGNVITKTAPLPNQTGASTVTTIYSYDKLNRLTAKSYKDGTINDPYTLPVQFGYDAVALTGCTTTPPSDADTYPVGQRTAMCDGSGATSWKHDQMGRVLQERRTIGSATGDYENDAYNLAGQPTSVTSLGYSVTYTYGSAGRALTATNYTGGTNKFVSAAAYAPPGELTAMTLGTTTSFTGIVTSNAYNDRLQPILLSAAVSGQNPVFSECFDFHLGIQVSTSPCSFSPSALGDNGNVYQMVDNRDNTRNEIVAYDSLNRIYSAQSNGTQWGETFTIDAWGNLTNETGISGKTNTEGLNTSANSNNQLAGYGYDAAGNMTSNGPASYVYDAENRLIATAGYSYIYDGNGQRVEKCTEGTTPGTCATGATGTLYWRGTSSDALSETDLAGNVQNNYVFFNGERVARRDSAGAIHYYFSDHLGSHGVVENATGSVIEQDIDYYPYGGQEYDYSTAPVPQHYKFTGKERDAESGLDEFGARYYSYAMGRFMTPDWEAKPTDVPYANFGNPQSLNLYSYVQNNPTTVGDPDGHCPPCALVLEAAIEEGGIAAWNYLAGAGVLGLTAAAAGASPSGNTGFVSPGYPSYYHGELQNANGTSIYLSKDNGAQSSDKNVPNPDGTKGAPDHQQTVREEAEKMGGKPEQRVETPGGEKGSRVIDAAKRDENGKVTEATQVIRPNKNGTPPAREVRAAADIQKATGVTPKLVPVRPIKKPDGQ